MDRRVVRAVDLLSKNPDSPIESICGDLHLSPSRLRHLFKAETGQSLGRFRRLKRLEHGRLLFATTFLSVKEVAVMLGGDPSHFRRRFKETFSMTPSKYRHSLDRDIPEPGLQLPPVAKSATK